MLLEYCGVWIYDLVCWLFSLWRKAHSESWLYKGRLKPLWSIWSLHIKERIIYGLLSLVLYCIPLWLLLLIIKAHIWFVFVELYWIKTIFWEKSLIRILSPWCKPLLCHLDTKSLTVVDLLTMNHSKACKQDLILCLGVCLGYCWVNNWDCGLEEVRGGPHI